MKSQKKRKLSEVIPKTYGLGYSVFKNLPYEITKKVEHLRMQKIYVVEINV